MQGAYIRKVRENSHCNEHYNDPVKKDSSTYCGIIQLLMVHHHVKSRKTAPRNSLSIRSGWFLLLFPASQSGILAGTRCAVQ